MSLLAQRRRRLEVAGKVGEGAAAPDHLIPRSVAPQQLQQQPYNPGQPVYDPQPYANGAQQPPQQYSPGIAAPTSYAAQAPLLPPPRSDYQPPVLPPLPFDTAAASVAAPVVPMPTYLSVPTGDGLPQREVRSAGHVYVSPSNGNAAYVGMPSPRLGPSEGSEPPYVQQQPPPFSAPHSNVDGPLYGRRARTTDGDKSAKEQRQAEYQREIQRQAEEARERKRLEKERLKRDDEAFERRVQDERQRIGEQEQREREKEVREREEREMAAIAGKPRKGAAGGNQQKSADLQRDLMEQIEEKKRRKEEEENKKRLDDEKYDRKFSAAGAAGPPTSTASAATGDAPSMGGGYAFSNSPPYAAGPGAPGGSQLSGPPQAHVVEGAPFAPPAYGPSVPYHGQPSVGLYQPQPPSSFSTHQSMSQFKDDVFSMMTGDMRLRMMQQNQAAFGVPPPATGGVSYPTYPAHHYHQQLLSSHYPAPMMSMMPSGGAPSFSTASAASNNGLMYGQLPTVSNMAMGGVGGVGVGGFASPSPLVSHGAGPSYAPMNGAVSQSNAWVLGGGLTGYGGATQQQQQQQTYLGGPGGAVPNSFGGAMATSGMANPSHILQQFLAADRDDLAGGRMPPTGLAEDDVSMELPSSEPARFLGQRVAPRR